MEDTPTTCFPCDCCDAKFSVKHKLLLHKWNAHFDPEVDSMYKCYRCDNIYPNQTELHSHACFMNDSSDVIYLNDTGESNGTSKPKHDSFYEEKILAGKIHSLVMKEMKRKAEREKKSGIKNGTVVCDSTTKPVKAVSNGVKNGKKKVAEKFVQCALCDEKVNLNTPIKLRDHVNAMHPDYKGKYIKAVKVDNLYKCKICKKGFTFSCGLGLHIKNQHPKFFTPSERRRKRQKKGVERKKEAENSNMQETVTKSKDGMFPCKHCDAKYKAAYKIIIHMRQKHPNLLSAKDKSRKKNSTCKICNRKLSTTSNLYQHMRRVHDMSWKPDYMVSTVSYKISAADTKEKEKKPLQTKKVSSEKGQVVKSKGKESKKSLSSEAAVNPNPNPSSKQSIKSSSKERSKSEKIKSVKCKCGKEFLYRRTLLKHAMFCHLTTTSSTENKVMKSFICQYCGLSYWYKRNMDYHIRQKHPHIHKKINIQKGGKDVTGNNLKHSGKVGENTQKITKKKKGNQLVSLSRNHNRVDLNRKMPKCSYCGKVQMGMSGLIEHRRLAHNLHRRHRGSDSPVLPSEPVKDEKISLFSKKDNFKKLHHKMPKCGTCGKVLASMSALFLHKKEVHNMDRKKKSKSTDKKSLKKKVKKSDSIGKALKTAKQSPEVSSTTEKAQSKKLQTSISTDCIKEENPLPESEEMPLCLVKKHLESPNANGDFDDLTDGYVKSSDGRYNCGHCNRAFSDKYSLGNHMQIWHIEKRHTCEHCNFTTMYPSNLNAHYAVKHRRL